MSPTADFNWDWKIKKDKKRAEKLFDFDVVQYVESKDAEAKLELINESLDSLQELLKRVNIDRKDC